MWISGLLAFLARPLESRKVQIRAFAPSLVNTLSVARLGINVGIIDHILTEDLSTINEGIPWGYIDQ
jgi:hypothetical protein